MQRNRWFVPLFAAALSLSSLTLFPLNAYAQTDAEEEATKRATLTLQEEGRISIKPNSFGMKVEIQVEGVGRSAQRDLFKKYQEATIAALGANGIKRENVLTSPMQLMYRYGENAYTTVTTPEANDRPDSVFRCTGELNFGVPDINKVQSILTALRATKVPGFVTLSHYATQEEKYRVAALKAAVQKAKQRLAVFADAAKPKEFELLFAKEGAFEVRSGSTRTSLQGTEPLLVLKEIDAVTDVTLMYGFRATGIASSNP